MGSARSGAVVRFAARSVLTPLAPPCNDAGNDVLSLQPVGARSITCMVQGREPRSFTFDQILWQTPQTDIFEGAVSSRACRVHSTAIEPQG